MDEKLDDSVVLFRNIVYKCTEALKGCCNGLSTVYSCVQKVWQTLFKFCRHVVGVENRENQFIIYSPFNSSLNIFMLVFLAHLLYKPSYLHVVINFRIVEPKLQQNRPLGS